MLLLCDGEPPDTETQRALEVLSRAVLATLATLEGLRAVVGRASEDSMTPYVHISLNQIVDANKYIG